MAEEKKDFTFAPTEKATQPLKFNFPGLNSAQRDVGPISAAKSDGSQPNKEAAAKGEKDAPESQKPVQTIFFNFANKQEVKQEKKGAKAFSKKIEQTEQKVLCEAHNVKTYYLHTTTDDNQEQGKQQWTEFDCGLDIQLLLVKGEEHQEEQKVFVGKLQLSEQQKPEINQEEEQKAEKIQKVIIKMSPGLSKFKKVGKRGFQVTGANFCMLDEKNQPVIKSYYVRTDDNFIAKLRENGVDV